ncbi:hypothetical protein, partial [Streptomyces plicatus]|uniref:hypothetical protein n=1 Tax=Streptomyces plicatus TaxID=1922 RepID=UPI001874D672
MRGQIYAVNRADAEAQGGVVEGILPICGFQARVLFDPGSTHSFISHKHAKLVDMHARELDFILTIATPIG